MTPRLRQYLANIRDYGYRPLYNGRPSCPFCTHFVDDDDTHSANCPLMTELGEDPATALSIARNEGYAEGYAAAVRDDTRLTIGREFPGPSLRDAQIMAAEAGAKDPFNLTSPDGGHNER